MSLNRRELLTLPCAAAAMAGEPARIARVEVIPAPCRVTSYFRFLPKPERPSVFVKITCQDGAVGWG